MSIPPVATLVQLLLANATVGCTTAQLSSAASSLFTQSSAAYTVELVYSGHPSEAAKWLLYTGGLLIEVFNVYVAHGKFRWDFPY